MVVNWILREDICLSCSGREGGRGVLCPIGQPQLLPPVPLTTQGSRADDLGLYLSPPKLRSGWQDRRAAEPVCLSPRSAKGADAGGGTQFVLLGDCDLPGPWACLASCSPVT